jgi:hypothetical protein
MQLKNSDSREIIESNSAQTPQMGTSALLDQMIGSPQPRCQHLFSPVLICVIAECLVKIDRLLGSLILQGFYELRNFTDTIVRQLHDSVDEFLLPYKHCEGVVWRLVLGRHAETFQNDDGIPRARQMLRTVPRGISRGRGTAADFLVCQFDILRVRAANSCAKEDSIAFTSELNRFASCGAKGDFFTPDFFSGNIFGQEAVSFQHHLDCFTQISPRLLAISAERDCSRKLSDRGLNQPIGLFIDYGQLNFH